jgi:hypothetical protein
VTAAPQFDAVATLGPHGREAADKLSSVHEELVRLGAPDDARRLLAVDRAARQRDFTALERLTSAEQSLDELSEIQHAGVRRLVFARNASALLPLLVTWFLLGWASLRYHQLLVAKPELSTEPFLALWQRRFDGALIPTFAETALAAFVLLAVILLLSWLAHVREGASGRVVAGMAAKVDDAMAALALAVQTSTVRPPLSAAEWAEAAQRVLAQTQSMISAAVADTAALAERNNEISKTAEATMTTLQGQAHELVAGLAKETTETLVAVRADNAQFIARTAEEAKIVLQQAGAANRQLVEQHMTPLFDGFRASLQEFRADQQVYRDSAAGLAGGVTELGRSAAVLASSAQTYTDIAGSIDKNLGLIQTTQSQFVTRVAEHSDNIATAAKALGDVAELLTGRMRGDLETLARSVVDAGAGFAAIDRHLALTSAALEQATREMRDAASRLATVVPAPPPRRRWLFWRRERP